jgi:hypothetical protein
LKELVIKSIQLPLKHNKIAFKMPSTTLAVPSSKLRKGDKNHSSTRSLPNVFHIKSAKLSMVSGQRAHLTTSQ